MDNFLHFVVVRDIIKEMKWGSVLGLFQEHQKNPWVPFSPPKGEDDEKKEKKRYENILFGDEDLKAPAMKKMKISSI